MSLKKYMIRQHLREEGKYLNYRIGSVATFVQGFFETENPETQRFIEESKSFPSIIVAWKPDTVSEKLSEADLEIQRLRLENEALKTEKAERDESDANEAAESNDGDPVVDISDLSVLAYPQMKKACNERGLEHSGSKDDLVERLTAWKAINSE